MTAGLRIALAPVLAIASMLLAFELHTFWPAPLGAGLAILLAAAGMYELERPRRAKLPEARVVE